MDLVSSGTKRCRLVGEYIIGPRIGSGSFAVVWRSKHRHLGTEFAIKEIDKKHLNDNLLKEISILRNITHPNIIRLFEAIETEERIYLVLEYCDGGDLGAYINRHGSVSEDVARHFMQQLAAGLQVLRENHLIHRDLKPQNLLLSGKGASPLLKIGDFGFARYLTPQGLADTLCGSPLYMAPEIIQNQKYDAKADLWSVGAILYQLVIGKPPFDGNSQLQLFQNILLSTDLRFPEGALKVLHPDCLELCRSLLRRNPVERITFEEFFNHRFLTDPRITVEAQLSSQIFQVESLGLTDGQRSQMRQEVKLTVPEESVKRDKLKASEDSVKRDKLKASEEDAEQDCSSVNDERREFRKHGSSSGMKDVHGAMPKTLSEDTGQSVDIDPHSWSKNRVADSMDSIEKGYVLVHSNFASMEVLTSSLGTSIKESSTTQACPLAQDSDHQMPTTLELKELAAKFGGATEITSLSGIDLLTASDAPFILKEMQGLSILHPSLRLQLLHQYVDALSDLAQEKLNAGFFLESFSIELVILAMWKEALRIGSSWLSSSGVNNLPEGPSGNEMAGKGAGSSSETEDATDFRKPSSASMWSEQGFIVACDRTEKLSKYLQDVDGAAEMPDAMEIIFQTALAAGRDGAADQLIGNRDSAATLYSRALILFIFIVAEAPSLPLNPPFSLAPDNKQRILKYIKNLQSHLIHSQMLQPLLKQLLGYITK